MANVPFQIPTLFILFLNININLNKKLKHKYLNINIIFTMETTQLKI